MARPSKLTEKEWAEIERRHLAGESIRSLAREFRVAASSISERISERTTVQKSVAKQLAAAEMAFSALPVSERISVRSLADELKAISSHLASAAKYGSMTAHKLNAIAHAQSEQIDEMAALADNTEALRSVIAMTEGANKAAIIGLNLLAANKDAVKNANTMIDITPNAVPNDPVEASRAYQRLINGI
jgi:hypothetical protein